MGFVEDFFNTLQVYNETFLPITVLTYILGVTTIYLVLKKNGHSDRIVSSILSFLWFWSAVVFFIIFYGPTSVEFLGVTMPGVWYLGGVLFLFQGGLFLVLGVFKSSLSFGFSGDKYSVIGASMIVYAILVYPVVGFLTGFNYPRYPVFGAPCPVVIFTLGMLLWSDMKTPAFVGIIPFIWAIMGVMPVIALDVFADVGLILSGAIGLPLILLRSRKTG